MLELHLDIISEDNDKVSYITLNVVRIPTNLKCLNHFYAINEVCH